MRQESLADEKRFGMSLAPRELPPNLQALFGLGLERQGIAWCGVMAPGVCVEPVEIRQERERNAIFADRAQVCFLDARHRANH
jgi:hypothetical protein